MKKDIRAALLPSLEQPLMQMGKHVRAARQARNWTIAEAAARIGVSSATYKRIEAGDSAVAFGSWMTAFMQMQLLGQIVAATTPAADKLGEALREIKAPKRIRSKKSVDGDRYDF